MNKEISSTNFYQVKVFLDNELMLEKTVKSKTPRNAITNVLTNIYKGDVDKVEIEKIKTLDKKTEVIEILAEVHQLG
jgi:hypothetical protein